MATPHIEGVTGQQYNRQDKGYSQASYQYATSSYLGEDRLNPSLVVQPQNKEDIVTAIKYAKQQGIAVAIKSGGHQYCGASSTSGKNIQLDLGGTFRTKEDLVFVEGDDGKPKVRTSVSWALAEVNQFLGDHHVFVPTGQCSHVHVGGHVQTGGYGQLGRSFGLFGDHVLALEIIDNDGNIREVSKSNDPDLFNAILGGSPGNFAVLTHFTIEVHRDADYQGSKGLKALYWYSPETLKYLLDIMVEMAEDENFPRNYDFCVSVLSSSFKVSALFDHSLDDTMKIKYPQIFGKGSLLYWPRTIIVYAQWVPLHKDDVCDMKWFEKINKKSSWELWWLGYNHVETKPMSQLTAEWIFRNVREFNHPYIKATNMTNSKTLSEDGWSSWISKRIDELVSPDDNGCYLSCQIQNFGGKNSRFTTNASNGTSYSWRGDSTICCTLDAFYDGDGARETAQAWHEKNQSEGIGKDGKFSKEDRRVLWGSYDEYNLDKVWHCYYENEQKYNWLRQMRQKADPNGVFTPNTFCVKRLEA